MKEIYYKDGDQIAGPVTQDELDYLNSVGKITASTLVSEGKNGPWKKIRQPNARRTVRPQRKAVSNAAVPVMATTVAASQSDPTSADPPAGNAIHNHQKPTSAADLTGDDDQSEQQQRVRRQIAAGAAAAILLLLLFFLLRNTVSDAFMGDGGGIASASTGQQGQTTGTESGGDEPDVPEPPEASPSTLSQPSAEEIASAADGSEADSNSSDEGSSAAPDRPEEDVADQSNAMQAGDPASRFTIAAPGEATFFGVTATGHRFAFVVDHSGSMQGLPLQRAKDELLKCLDQLPDSAEATVIFFDMTSMEVPGGLQPLSKRNRKTMAQWVTNISPGGGTSPAAGVQPIFATGREPPDVIFLLTDGGFNMHEVNMIRGMNSSDSQINTVALISRAGEYLLKQIASQNRGDYRFVP